MDKVNLGLDQQAVRCGNQNWKNVLALAIQAPPSLSFNPSKSAFLSLSWDQGYKYNIILSLLDSETITKGLIFWILLCNQLVYPLLLFFWFNKTNLTKSLMCLKLIEYQIKPIETIVFIGQNGEVLVILDSLI